MERNRSDRDRREGTLSLDCSRFARQEGCCQQGPEPLDTVTCEPALSDQPIALGDDQIVGSQFDAVLARQLGPVTQRLVSMCSESTVENEPSYLTVAQLV
jgi:hypothetical protein